MLELYQAEWCPDSHKVRQRLTELGVPFIARQVAPEADDRDQMRAATGSDTIPVLILEDGIVLALDAEKIVGELDRLYTEPDHAAAHREYGAAAHYDDPAKLNVSGAGG
jgi:glutaredoxin